MARIKRKFYAGQTVVFRFSERKLVGKVIESVPVGKNKFLYEVEGEDGKVYSEMPLDAEMNYTIDSYLTKLFYRKYNISADTLPVTEEEESTIDFNDTEVTEADVIDDSEPTSSDEDIFESDEIDSNW
jgi:hypothetical protein